MTILGRQGQLPGSHAEWVQIAIVLSVIAISFRCASGWNVAALGVVAGSAAFLYDHHLYLPVAISLAGAIALIAGRGARRPRSTRFVGREVVYLAVGMMLYEWGRSLFVGDADTATANGQRVIRLEQSLGLSAEDSIQRVVLRHDEAVRTFNWIYSFGFLSFVLAGLFYLLVADSDCFRFVRNGLGMSAILALVTIALYPTAPPRLVAESGLVDTHDLLGKAHGFVNAYAAMPSLHVGWVALIGVGLARSSRSIARWCWGFVPALVMLTTVIATGNHYWLDGLVGMTFCLVPVSLLTANAEHRATAQVWLHGLPGRIHLEQPAATAVKVNCTLISMGSLVAYLVGREMVDPGFTDYWGYMVAQLLATIVILIGLDNHFAEQGGLSWFTHGVVIINTWADSLGTAGHMYDKYASYDKITHFLGGVMLTAAMADTLFAISIRRSLGTPTLKVLAMAALVAISLGAGWELYEYVGDKLFHTGRHAGSLDTEYDLVSDSVGAIVSVVLLWRGRLTELERRAHKMTTAAHTR